MKTGDNEALQNLDTASQRSRRIASLAILFALFALSLSSCGISTDRSTTHPGIPGPVREPSATARIAAPTPPRVPPLAPTRVEDSVGYEVPAASTPPQSPSPVTAVETATLARRDLRDELRHSLGTPLDCITADMAEGAETTLRAAVNVQVSSAGRVTRAEVTSSLPESARDCLTRLAERVHFTAPVPDAPRTVTTELVMQLRVSRPGATAGESPPRRPEGFVAPSATLPAVGAEGRPAGFIAPDETLPAIGAEERPEGSVAPDETLPAQGEPIPWQHAGQ